MVSFILNDKIINTDNPPGMTLLDFIRNDANLKGTKIGCREGDCGACTVIEGQLTDDKVSYKTIVSCLTPLGNVNGKHIVTIEGINPESPSPVQTTLVEYNGTQCGFCTPGFVISLTAFLLSDEYGFEKAREAIDGNICRCTGYKSIERAAMEISEMKSNLETGEKMEWLVQKGFIPPYFMSIPEKLNQIQINHGNDIEGSKIVAGGTDLLVQKADEIFEQKSRFIHYEDNNKEIASDSVYCSISGAVTVANMLKSKILQKHFPKLRNHLTLISSTPIRNMATLAGNIVNASPIGDLSIYFLALNAEVHLIGNHLKKRVIPLRKFFIDYKKLDKLDTEIIEKIVFKLPDNNTCFNFEKVSKRQYLDIASVNSAISIQIEHNTIKKAHLVAGGVSPIPLYLKTTSAFLVNKEINVENIIKANAIAQEEISPISDIRGSADYKRLLLRQLIFAHFIELFEDKISITKLLHTI